MSTIILRAVVASALAAWLSAGAGSYSATLAGSVVDAATGDAVVGARVRLVGAGREARTDDVGDFSFGAYEVGVDTLEVLHQDYHAARFVLGEALGSHVDLTIELRSSRLAEYDVVRRAPLRGQALEMIGVTGGALWPFEDFAPYLRQVAHPLELLLFSGFADEVYEGSNDEWCVRLVGGNGCAAVWVNEIATAGPPLRGRFPAEVEAFVVVKPGRSVLDPGVVQDASEGVVMVFLVERTR